MTVTYCEIVISCTIHIGSIYVMKICFTTPDMGCCKGRGLRHGGGRGQRQRRAGDNGSVVATFSISDSLKTEGCKSHPGIPHLFDNIIGLVVPLHHYDMS